MREYVEQGCSAKRHGMHRRVLKGIFKKWKGRTGIEKKIDTEGSAWHWIRAGRLLFVIVYYLILFGQFVSICYCLDLFGTSWSSLVILCNS